MKSARAQEPIFYVYEHWRPDTGQCFYVGKGYGHRAGAMAKRNPHHRNIQALLARLGMSVEVRMVAAELSEQEAFDIERAQIAHWRANGIALVNLTDGGEGTAGLKRGPETRAKMAASAKFRPPRTAEQNAHHSRMLTGRKQNPETVRKRAEKLTGRKHSPERIAKASRARIGKKATPEARERMSKAHMGKTPAPKSPDGLRRIREARKAYWARKRAERDSAQGNLWD